MTSKRPWQRRRRGINPPVDTRAEADHPGARNAATTLASPEARPMNL